MEITTIRKIALSSLVQNLKVPDSTQFYSYGMNGELFATAFVLDDNVKTRHTISVIQDSEQYVMPDDKLLVILRNLTAPIEVNAVDRPPQFGTLYLSLCSKDDMTHPRECRIVSQFFGHSFKVLRVAKQELYTGERHFMVSSEYLSPRDTFKSQARIDRDARIHIVSEFITREQFMRFQDKVVNEIAVI